MTPNEKLIKDFIDGPLKEYLTGDISYGKFKERINEVCGTNFSYSDLYPSYLFNARLSYEESDRMLMEDLYDKNLSTCHRYGLCADPKQELDVFDRAVVKNCSVCPRKNNGT